MQKSEQVKISNQKKIQNNISFHQKLDELKATFFSIATNANHQQRGYQLESFLNELFIIFDLDPKSSFKIINEQIDGAFTFDNSDYLLEAKWQSAQVNASDLYKFGGVILSKLKNTLGLFVSIDGFTPDCINSTSSAVNSIILMDGPDLIQILEGRIRLNEMLYKKRRHAAKFYGLS